MFEGSHKLWMQISVCLIFAGSLMLAPNIRTTEILTEDLTNERTGALHSGTTDLVRRRESSRLLSELCGRESLLRQGDPGRLGRVRRLSVASGHLMAGHRHENALLAPLLT
jgi:hypothetical protein